MKRNLKNLSAYDLGSVSKIEKFLKSVAASSPKLPNREGAYNLNSKNYYPRPDTTKK